MIRPIVFAAGLGTRMGAIKALIPIDEVPAIARLLQTIAAAGLSSPMVVLGRDAEEIQSRVDLAGCQVVVNEHPEDGLSSSMKLALGSLNDTDEGLLTFLVDMPYLDVTSIRAVLTAVSRGATLAAPYYEAKRGFPVYFHRCWIAELKNSLCGDSGGRRFLGKHNEHLVRVDVTDPGSVFDLDCPSDLITWKGVHACAINE